MVGILDKKELLKTTAAEVVAKFKVRKKYPCNNMVDGKSAFPYPIALAATFNENLVLNVGEAYAREVLAEGVDASHDACITFNAEMGNCAYSFGDGEVNLHLTAAFSKGLEKGGAVAFPSVNYGSKAAEALIKSNASHGIMLGVGEAKPADIARFRGLIYGKSTF